jgi:hypothetical protein
VHYREEVGYSILMVSLRALTKLITGLTPVIGYNRYLMFLENCIYLIKHPWILVLSGLEGIAFALLFGLIVRKFIGNFTITNKWVDLALYLSLFIILNIFVGSYKPLTWLATAYDTELYQNFLEKVITDSPLIWENITWFWYIVVTVSYSLWIYIVVKFYRTSL